MDLSEKNKNGISKYDIQKVANDLTIGITDEQLTTVFEQYDDVIGDYPKDENWTIIVEDLIWNL